MYEMYPEAWPTAGERRQQQGEHERPRRRVRKQHEVLPAALADTARDPWRPGFQLR